MQIYIHALKSIASAELQREREREHAPGLNNILILGVLLRSIKKVQDLFLLLIRLYGAFVRINTLIIAEDAKRISANWTHCQIGDNRTEI